MTLGFILAVVIVALLLLVGLLIDRLRAERARLRDALRREHQARRERDRVVEVVTYDLATPLSAIQSTIQCARRHSTMSELQAFRLLIRMERAAARVASLARALADSKSLDAQSLTLSVDLVDLRTLVGPIVRMLDRLSDRHPITLTSHSRSLVVLGDAYHLARMVESLITNAVKYSPAGGAIEVRMHEEQGFAELTVRDYGIGFSPSELERIFEPGYRTPRAVTIAPGLGLGLYLSSEVIRRHGGTIAGTAQDLAGALFTVRLPLAGSSPAMNLAHAGSRVELQLSAQTVH